MRIGVTVVPLDEAVDRRRLRFTQMQYSWNPNGNELKGITWDSQLKEE
jgi:hypothetical protein